MPVGGVPVGAGVRDREKGVRVGVIRREAVARAVAPAVAAQVSVGEGRRDAVGAGVPRAVAVPDGGGARLTLGLRARVAVADSAEHVPGGARLSVGAGVRRPGTPSVGDPVPERVAEADGVVPGVRAPPGVVLCDALPSALAVAMAVGVRACDRVPDPV